MPQSVVHSRHWGNAPFTGWGEQDDLLLGVDNGQRERALHMAGAGAFAHAPAQSSLTAIHGLAPPPPPASKTRLKQPTAAKRRQNLSQKVRT